MQTIWPIEDSLFLLLKGACRQVSERAVAQAHERTGIHGAQLLALLALARIEPCKVVTLAQNIDVKRAAATALVQRLEKGGFVRRAPDPNDARAVLLKLTPHGWRALEDAAKLVSRFDERLHHGFSDEEIATVRRFLMAARNAL